jgi:hypothetical protein
MAVKGADEVGGRGPVTDEQAGIRIQAKDEGVPVNEPFVVEPEGVMGGWLRAPEVGGPLVLEEVGMVLTADTEDSRRMERKAR